jgi:hypothetical protein
MKTGVENQARLYEGYAKIAYQLGFPYDVYPFDLISPISDSTKLPDKLNCAFSADVNFVAPLKYDGSVYYLWCDGDAVDQWYFLQGPEGTFYVADKQGLLPIQAVRCNTRVTIGRGEYSDIGPIIETVVPYAEALPIFMQFTREDIQKPNIQYGQQIGRAVTHWSAFIPCPQGTIRQDDIMTDDLTNIRYLIDAPDFTHIGYVCRVRLATV